MADGLVAALARAQAAFPPIVKSHSNPAFKGSQYADVADVLAAVRPVLAAEGIVVSQSTDVTEWGTLLITALRHGTDKLLSSFRLPVEGLTAQQVGSLLTYHRRYQLCAILGVHPVGDDDDGNLAATAPARPAQQASASLAAFVTHGDPYALAAASPPSKPLASMSAGEMARYGESIGVRVSGNKTDILRTLQPYVLAATGEDPFLVDSPTTPGRQGDGDGPDAGTAQGTAASPPPSPPFSPTIAEAGSVRKGVNSALKADS